MVAIMDDSSSNNLDFW